VEAPGTGVAFVLVLTRATDAAGHSTYRPSTADLAFRTMSFAKIVIRQHIDIRIDLSKQCANFGGS
jgi:hypothetical protein